MLRHLPNFLTLLNLFSGSLATVAVLRGDYVLAFWLVIICLAADFFDGGLARALKVSSELGKQLDSIADAVSFGVVPGAIFYQMIALPNCSAEATICWAAIPGFFVSAAAGLRLARFNLDYRQLDSFIGLPTPSLTMFALGLLMIHQYNTFGLAYLLEETAVLYLLVGFLCYILNAPLPMFSLKFKSLTWKGNEIKFIFMAVAAALLAIWREAGLAMIIALYILVSAAQFLAKKK
jgi:CDP-diacylglycerol--serine O-phosphatidyltransferase